MRSSRFGFLLTLLVTVSFAPLLSIAQNSTPEKAYLSKEGLNRLLNLKFGSILTGQSNSTSIGNYASLDPVNGSFTFKGSFGIGQKQDSAQISYLTFRLQGDLISDSYAALFSNSKLNTGGLIEAQYHLRLGKAGITFYHDDRAKVHLDTLMEYIDYMNKIDALFKADSVLNKTIQEQRLQYAQAMFELELNRRRMDSVTTVRVDALNNRDSASLKKSTAASDSISALVVKGESNLLQLGKVRDSLNYVQSNTSELRNARKQVINEAHKQKIIQIEMAAPYNKMALRWLTVTAGVSKKKYYTFDATFPFSSQIVDTGLSTVRLGLAYNFYREVNETKHARFFNIGFLLYKDNNTSLLSTQQINQEAVFKNAAGDTTRKVTKQYNAYTDPIVKSDVLSLFANWYFIQKGKARIFHLYPSVDIYSKGKTLTNFGLGYIVSFKNTKKDQPIINTEAYVQFQDLFNELDKKAGFWNRNEIGVRFTLPFNFF